MPGRRSHVAPSAAQGELAAALADLRASNSTCPTASPPRCSPRRRPRHPRRRPPQADRRDLAVRHDRSSGVDGPRPGPAPRAPRRRLRGALRDRGCPGLRASPTARSIARPGARGQTLYAADGRVPLHPPVLSEDRVSLLPDVDRSAYLWTFELDRGGRRDQHPTRARDRALARAAELPRGAGAHRRRRRRPARAPARGRARRASSRSAARGGASLNVPDEEIVRTADGGYALERRRLLPVEEWNAQLSLMTGMAAAELMLEARVGILRTMPAPTDERIAAFRTQTEALGRPWPSSIGYGEYLRGLDRDDPAAPRDHAGGGRPVPRGRVRGDGRHRAGRPRAVRARRAVRPRHRAAAAARGPVGPRRLRGAQRRTRGAGVGAGLARASCRRSWARRRSGRAGSRRHPSRASRRPCSPTASASDSSRRCSRCAATTPSSSWSSRRSPRPARRRPACAPASRLTVVLERADIRTASIEFRLVED